MENACCVKTVVGMYGHNGKCGEILSNKIREENR